MNRWGIFFTNIKSLPFFCFKIKDGYWLYEVNGIPPPSGPSKDTKAKVDCINKAYDNKTTKVNNFIQKNVKLVKAKLSCTSKDSPLTLKNK